MEIYSVRSSQNLHYKNNANNAKNTKTADISIHTATSNSVAFHVEEVRDPGLDFTSISPGELRSHARQSFDSGLIDQDTYAALSEPLPMHAIDARGNLIDLSAVTDGTSFDFVNYYQNQLQIAMSIGEPETVRTLNSILNFLTPGLRSG